MSLGKWIPDRKVLAGGIVGVVSFFAAQALGIPAEIAAQVAGGLWLLANYFIPASVSDVVNKIDSTLKKIGGDEEMTVAEVKAKAAEKP